MHRSQIFLLRPTNAQAKYFARAAGTARMSYNWALAEWKRQAAEWWESGKQTPFPSAFSLQKRFAAIKREQWPWITDVASLVNEAAIFAVGQAFEAYRAGQTRYPKFKSRDTAKLGFVGATAARDIILSGRTLRLPKVGVLKLSRACRWPGARATRAVVTHRAGKWYASVTFDLPDVRLGVRQFAAAGVDLGIKTPLTVTAGGVDLQLGNGLRERLNAERRKLRRANKRLHRRQKGSGRRRRAQLQVARIHKRLSDVRADFQHKATSLIAGMASRIGVETLNVSGLLRNRSLSRNISDVGFYEIRRQLSYKADALVEAGRFYPSSKTCSCCGSVKEKLTLSDRIFICEDCGFTCDRDVNAARNLERMAADEAVSARGDRSPAKKRKLRLSSLSKKREVSEAAASG